ncbi:cytochrome c-type biogenesis protein [Streptococcus gallinaceus]|uniref:thiol-disulfide oxidoreductase-associated membrane protein CcdA2 n=1 Tax=Streptococcus gallinaceus TaxID=165758 RepID=UPI0020A1CC6C|nr:thiol-disulfide oxidoreductase-associated membrane protein CcdA2 [Streptococcus gallinaceus]MCP1640118.1 cytochrome c-type biogenesis protein [Streptococcus gallinaceus]
MDFVFVGSVFLAGLVSFFSPCIFPVLPVYLGLLLDVGERRVFRIGRWTFNWYGVAKTLVFILGLSTIFVLLGYGAGALGQVLYADWFRILLGLIVIALGLHQMGVLTFRRLELQKSLIYQHKKERNAFLSAYLLGLTFSFGWTPCVGPVLSSVLAIAATGSKGALQGGLLMLVYTLGLGIPFILLSLAQDMVLKQFNRLKPHIGLLKKVGGALIIVMGLILMFGQLNSLASLLH